MSEVPDDPLVIRVVRSGGGAGMTRTGTLELHPQSPTSGQETSWVALAQEALADLRAAKESAAPSQRRDSFMWSLDFDGEKHSVADALLTGPARTLAEHIIGTPRPR